MSAYSKKYKREVLTELFSNKWNSAAKALLFITLKASPVWLIPVVTAKVIDLANQPEPSIIRLVFYLSIGILLFLQNIPAALYYTKNIIHLTRGIGRDLRIKICKQLQVLSLYYHSRHSVGKVHTKAIRDIEIIEQLPKLAYEQGYSFLLGLVITSVVIFLSKPIALILFIPSVAACGIIAGLFRRRMSATANEYRKSIEGMSMHLNEMVTMIPLTRAHGLEAHQLRSVENGIHGVFDRGSKFDMLTELFRAISWVVMGVMQLLCLGVSIYACFLGHITIGDVVMYNSFFITLSSSFANLLTFVPQLMQTRESLDSIIEVFNSPSLEANEGKEPYQLINGEFELRNVSFKYPDSSKHIIRDFNLHIKAGTSVAITGPSGGGKSTLLSLLLGFTHPTKGQIRLDGKDMAVMDLRTYRQQVGVVTQDPVLFSGTIAENVAYGNDSVSEAQLFGALEQANAREFIDELPEGVNTRLGVNGIKLSGGQTQRIAIARAIIRDPKILILDEATSALDVESELLIQKAMDNIMKDRTTFIVAHRMSTLKNADLIAILDAGKLLELGRPDDLRRNHNFYSRALEQSTSL
ncbi:ABC transporter ATP-binding protein/permease [bacterium]|nr:ABC transporter ATP-binding protein/permease [bacterium]